MASTRMTVSCTGEGLFLSRAGAPTDIFAFSVDVSGRLKFTPKAALPPRPAVTHTFEADAMYGAFALLKGYYVAFVTESARVAAAPNGAAIFQVLDMDWMLVGNGYSTSVKDVEKAGHGPALLTPAQEHEEETHLALLKRVTETSSFYFCPEYDLTNSLQRNDAATAGALSTDALSPLPSAPPLPSWVHSDERFWWNREALREVLAAGVGEQAARPNSGGTHPYVVPIINGFVGGKPVPEFSGELLLLSRRACERQGTRFNMRGADMEGNVANYAETEQILRMGNGGLSSFVQLRGSVPLLWEQPVTMKYTPSCKLEPSRALNNAVFSKHAATLLDRYRKVTAVNLIDKKGDQKALGQAYADAVEAFSTTAAGDDGGRRAYKYVWFDFHGETKSSKGGWASLSKLLNEVRPELEGDGVYRKDPSGRVVSVQVGTFRTNCMDNLDRTNVVQSLFARQAGLSAVPGALERTRASGCSVLTSPFPEFERAFNNLWADNADAMSFLYSGTGALKTDFTRTGKRTIAGALQDGVNSVQRYVLNNLDDGRMQDAWDLFLGRYVPSPAVAPRSSSSSYTPAMAAHLAGPTPTGVLMRIAALFGALTLVWAGVLTSHKSGHAHRLTVGAGAATVTVLALAFAIVSKGWLRPLARTLVSRPAFRSAVKDVAGGVGASYSALGREKDGVVGGAHAREHSTLTPGVTVAAATTATAEDGTRAKLA